MTTITIDDWGSEQYLDGCMMQYCIRDSEDKVIAFVQDREKAFKIAQALGDEVVIKERV